MQLVAPAEEKELHKQSKHCPEAGSAYAPALHVDATHAEEPAGAKKPLAQGTQIDAFTAPNVAAGHAAEHAVAPAPE